MLAKLDPHTIAHRLRAGALTLIDIREPDEYAREHIPGAVSVPLSRIEQADLIVDPQKGAAFHCKSGMRTTAQCARLAARVEGEAFMMEGGLEAWKAAGLPIASDAKAPLELNRQVQIAAGAMIAAGAALALVAHPAFAFAPLALGAGLVFAGVSGWCGLAKALALAPWNRRAA
ncbi:MAG: rhodanese-like domain-containing protein [Hyphomonadaceae bacterium]|nr:rhodanese-like domain-containing protein [Hyphomonadaceae bacterium]